MHRRFAEPSNPDVLAFHEAFADLVALFQHFSFPDALRHQLARTRGDLGAESLLGQLAQEFGRGTGGHGALRDALGDEDASGAWTPAAPDPTKLARTPEPHDRGSVLVAAVFGAFVQIYRERTARLLRIATGGSGVLPAGALAPDLVDALADEAAKAASHLLRMCVRALDYCPPVDVTFGDYLRALVTADRDLVPADEHRYRVALVESFRAWGIYPDGVRNLSQEALLWDPPGSEHAAALRDLLGTPKSLRDLAPDWGLSTDREKALKASDRAGFRLNRRMMLGKQRRGGGRGGRLYAAARALGLSVDDDAPWTITRSPTYEGAPAIEFHAVRPARRVAPSGEVHTDLIVVVTQKRGGYLDEGDQRAADRGELDKDPDFVFRGGATLLVDLSTGGVRYLIGKSVLDGDRLARQRRYLRDRLNPAVRGVYFGGRSGADGTPEPFAFLHRSAPQPA